MITIFDVPSDIRKTLPAKKIASTLELITESLEEQGLNNSEIKEIISSKGFWLGILKLSQISYNMNKIQTNLK